MFSIWFPESIFIQIPKAREIVSQFKVYETRYLTKCFFRFLKCRKLTDAKLEISWSIERVFGNDNIKKFTDRACTSKSWKVPLCLRSMKVWYIWDYRLLKYLYIPYQNDFFYVSTFPAYFSTNTANAVCWCRRFAC